VLLASEAHLLRFDLNPLSPHLYNRGLLSGKHSDITVHAFGHAYPLHRLLLDRAPFFSTALSGPWYESSARDITLDPADVDANITQAAFEIALKRIYGVCDPVEEDQEAIGLFAVGCWLEMDDLVDASIASLLRQMCPERLSGYIRFVTGSYYGRNGDRILASAKAMLCKSGWEMDVKYWDAIPGDIIREMVGSDGFFVPGEWERWALARRILNRRLRKRAREAGLVDGEGRLKKAPMRMAFMAVRFDTIFRTSGGVPASRDGNGNEDQWVTLYTHPDIAPLLVLLDEGVHYVHLSFEQLQKIREQKDALGLPLLPEKVISTNLWMAMELRQRIINAHESEMELGLSQQIEDVEGELVRADREAGYASDESHEERIPKQNVVGEDSMISVDSQSLQAQEMSAKAAGKRAQRDEDAAWAYNDDDDDDQEGISDSWDGNGKPRKFWIPHADATFPMGEGLEPPDKLSTPPPRMRATRTTRLSATRFSTSIPPEDVQWATDFASSNAPDPTISTSAPNAVGGGPGGSRSNSPTIATVPSPQVSYSTYPPFRFAVEFPAARALKENKRVYSPTIWYAGSLWNVYVQKKETLRGPQLGVYLHRERLGTGAESSADEIIAASYLRHSRSYGHVVTGAGVGAGVGERGVVDVDQRIAQIEREFDARRHRGLDAHGRAQLRAARAAAIRAVSDDAGTNANSTNANGVVEAGSDDPTLVNDLAGSISADLDTLSGVLRSNRRSATRRRNGNGNGNGGGKDASANLNLNLKSSTTFPLAGFPAPSRDEPAPFPSLAPDPYGASVTTFDGGLVDSDPDSGPEWDYDPDDEDDEEDEEALRLWNLTHHAVSYIGTPTPTSTISTGTHLRTSALANTANASIGLGPGPVGKRYKKSTPTLPLYVDARPTIRTYFKIYTPGKGGRVLTAYESRPDRFNFSQSWGWKSGSLVVDEVEMGKGNEGGRLRFMIVVGNV